MLSIAMIGAGSIAKYHLEAAQDSQRIRFCAVADTNLQRAEQLGADYKAKAYVDYKEMIEQEKPDAVLITLPHFLHSEVAIWCIAKGCHVYLEKPMAMNVQECKDIAESASNHKVKLMIGHTQHYIAENIQAKQLILQNKLGKLIMIQDRITDDYFTADRPQWFLEKDKSGGGILMNLGCHAIDRIQWLTNSRIRSVRASLGFYGDRGDVEGNGIVYFETTDGVAGTILQCGYNSVIANYTELFFTKGTIRIDPFQQLWVSCGGPYEKVEYPQTNAFAAQLDDFAAAVLDEAAIDCNGEYGLSVIAVISSIYRSHELGMEVDVE